MTDEENKDTNAADLKRKVRPATHAHTDTHRHTKTQIYITPSFLPPPFPRLPPKANRYRLCNLTNPLLVSPPARQFSFFSTDDAAEVQLGGYDPATVSDTMWYTTALSADDFIVGTSSLRFGHSKANSVELLQFRSTSQKQYGAPSIMDSGTSCLVIPADNMEGQLANVPWDDFAAKWEKVGVPHLNRRQSTAP
jgi:hypothetical protein